MLLQMPSLAIKPVQYCIYLLLYTQKALQSCVHDIITPNVKPSLTTTLQYGCESSKITA